MDQRKYALIIGAMKSGTTTLYALLSQHPNICPSIKKEPEFFSEEYLPAASALAAYNALWQFAPLQHSYALEASTSYTIYPMKDRVAAKIHKTGIRPKFIYIVRNPFDRILSDYNFSLNKAWFDPKHTLSSERFLCITRYYSQLAQYLEYFDRDDFLILDFDDLTQRPTQLLNTVLQFLELPTYQFSQAEKAENTTQIVNKWQHIGHQNWFIRALKHRLPKGLKQAIQQALPTKPVNRSSLTEAEKSSIQQQLADDMRLFKQHFGFPIEKWGF